MPTNPNGANQYVLDPRQSMCWELYITPGTEWFGNALQSAIKAGYDSEYAEHIKDSDWFSGKLRRFNMRKKGEKVLEEMLDMPVETIEYSRSGVKEDFDETDDEDGEVKKVLRQVIVTSPALVKIKQDTAKFAVERLGKEDWSTRQELSGPDGKPLSAIDAEQLKEKIDKAINEYLNPDNSTGQ